MGKALAGLVSEAASPARMPWRRGLHQGIIENKGAP